MSHDDNYQHYVDIKYIVSSQYFYDEQNDGVQLGRRRDTMSQTTDGCWEKNKKTGWWSNCDRPTFCHLLETGPMWRNANWPKRAKRKLIIWDGDKRDAKIEQRVFKFGIYRTFMMTFFLIHNLLKRHLFNLTASFRFQHCIPIRLAQNCWGLVSWQQQPHMSCAPRLVAYI